VVTPSGLEGASNPARPSETDATSTENLQAVSVLPIVARRVCSNCSKAAHLAGVAANAVRDFDLDRALELLAGIAALAGGGNTKLPGEHELGPSGDDPRLQRERSGSPRRPSRSR